MRPRVKTTAFVLEGLNSLSSTYFFYYFYFYTQERFHFGTLQNLLLAALQGTVYALGAFYGGRFAERFGYYNSVRAGTATLVVSILLCVVTESLAVTELLFVLATLGLCLTWPALEAMATEGEPPVRLQSMVGIYNFVWAATGAAAYFTGGAMLHHWGLKSMFYVPAGLMAIEFLLATWLQGAAGRQPAHDATEALTVLHPTPENYTPPVPKSVFLKMAWLANPMAYLSINTIISTIPSLARRLAFTPERAGFVFSLWLFARTAAFVALRLWPGWHYRFRFLATAYVMMLLSFGSMLLAVDVWMLLAAQLFFGASVGLIYYSSLFYSMDAGEAKGEHGGIHEAVIGLGNAAGPATAAAALYFFHGYHGSGTGAVCVLLTAGFATLLWFRFRRPART